MPKYPGAVLKKGSSGAAVAAVQKQLKARGFDPGPVDGAFGPLTARAVKDFQSREDDATGRSLTIDGEVGPLTWAALFGAVSLPAPPKPTNLGKAIADQARGLLAAGVREMPSGANWGDGVTDILKWCGQDGPAQWCQYTAWWCAFHAAITVGLVKDRAGAAARWRPISGQTWTTSRWAIRKGWFSTADDVLAGRFTPQPGDFCFVHLSAAGGHVEVVAGFVGGKVQTIGGNVSGNKVGARQHNLSDIKRGNGGFCRLR